MHIDAYLGRIGYSGPRAATLEALQALVAAHTRAVPFENIDVMLGLPIRLDLPSLELKLVQQRRGGYCYEQNTLFAAVLAAFGFTLRGLAARVLWTTAPDARPRPRTHMILRVDLDRQSWLADVGFGHSSPAPLMMRTGIEQHTSHGDYRLLPNPAGLELQFLEPAGWRPMYRFSGETQEPEDYEMGNFYVSNAPHSVFRQHLLMARVADDGRHSLLDNRYTSRDLAGRVHQGTATTPDALRALIAGPLGCAPPDSAAFDALLQRLTT